MAKKNSDFKAEFLKHLEEHKEQLGDDYNLIKDKIMKMKEDAMSKEEVKNIEEWIKKHPFLAVALAMILGAALYKVIDKIKGD